MAVIVVFRTTYALILPAITWERSLICQLPEHIHTDACFDALPAEDDGYYRGQIVHMHNEYCYFSDGTLRCTIEEHEH